MARAVANTSSSPTPQFEVIAPVTYDIDVGRSTTTSSSRYGWAGRRSTAGRPESLLRPNIAPRNTGRSNGRTDGQSVGGSCVPSSVVT